MRFGFGLWLTRRRLFGQESCKGVCWGTEQTGQCRLQPVLGSFGAMLPMAVDGWVEIAQGVGPCFMWVLVGCFTALPYCNGKPAVVVASLLGCEL
jgi:hypothetical protein